MLPLLKKFQSSHVAQAWCGLILLYAPPSALAILECAIGLISIGRTLIAIIVPGLLMATLYAAYIIGRCRLQPSLAPPYELSLPSLSEKLIATVRYILPLGFIVFLVVGVIFIGIATPTEAAASGALGCFILAAFYKKLNWETVKKSVSGTLSITVMIFMIVVGATAFTQILAYSGASQGLVELALRLPVPPICTVIAIQVVVLILGCFMNLVPIMMITLPIYVPVIQSLGFDLVWFAVVYILNLEMAGTTPPYGLTLFVVKGMAPPGTTTGDIYQAALLFLYCDAIAMALIIAFPQLVLWLPGLMRT